MKKFIVLTLLGASSIGAFAQGSLTFGNNINATIFRAPIFGPVPTNPGQQIVGQSTSALFFPTGTTLYQGATFLNGTGFSLAVFGGPNSTVDPANLVLLTQTTFRTGGSAGFVNTGAVQIPGADAGTAGKFQVRAWDNLGGTITSWALALANPAVAKGTTPMVTTGALGGVDSNGNAFPVAPDSTGWTSFNIAAVPEPSTFVLAGLGAAGLLIFRRRK